MAQKPQENGGIDMSFELFAQSLGLLVSNVHQSDKICRCPTVNHPHSKNGSFFWNGEYGWVKNWELDDKIHVYKQDRPIDKEKLSVNKNQLKKQISESYNLAKITAKKILDKCKPGTHYYLNTKGFRDTISLILEDDEPQPKLIIPMRDFYTNELLGVQKIQWDGSKYIKKMLSGMRAKGAVFAIGNQSSTDYILCEGYATGLSIHEAVKSLCLDACVLVCFSDSNLAYIAGLIWDKKVYIYADNDESGAGQRAAIQAGYPYVMSKKVGNDANDDMTEFGLQEVCNNILKIKAHNRK